MNARMKYLGGSAGATDLCNEVTLILKNFVQDDDVANLPSKFGSFQQVLQNTFFDRFGWRRLFVAPEELLRHWQDRAVNACSLGCPRGGLMYKESCLCCWLFLLNYKSESLHTTL